MGRKGAQKKLEEEVRRKKAARANKEPVKRVNIKNKIMGIEDPEEKARRKAPFQTDLHVCQIAIYNVANMIDGNPRNLGHYEELGFFQAFDVLDREVPRTQLQATHYNSIGCEACLFEASGRSTRVSAVRKVGYYTETKRAGTRKI